MQRLHHADLFISQIHQLLQGRPVEATESFTQELKQQQLLGFAYSRGVSTPEALQAFQWQKMWNQILLDESQDICEKLRHHQVEFAFLKGIPLLSQIYRDLGSRYNTDIDVYVRPHDFDKVQAIFVSMGYKKWDEKRWAASRFKMDFIRPISGNSNHSICVDLHSKLFYRESPDTSWTIQRDTTLPCFAIEDQLVHLIAHYAYVHSLDRFRSLIDIYLFLNEHQEALDSKKLSRMYVHHGLQNAADITFHILKRCFPSAMARPNSKNWLAEVCTSSYLLAPHRNKLRYLIVKHFVKPSVLQAVEYDLLWLHSKLTGRY